MSRHLMLTVLGLEPRSTRYTLGGQEVRADLAPVALLDLLAESERPDGVLALCTSEAKQETGGTLVDQLENRYDVRLIDIPTGEDQDQIGKFLDVVTSKVPNDVDLTVDITHGFRHYSFLVYTALMYLTELCGVRIRGMYYGLLGQGKNGTSPFLDLRPLMELPRWTRALYVLRTTGSALPIADLLDTGKGQPRKGIREEFRGLSEAYLAGLPLELGERALKVKDQRLKAFAKILRTDHHLPLSNELVGRLAEILAPQALEGRTPGPGWKRMVRLSKNELSRQARVIDSLFDNGHLPTALGLMHEWTVIYKAIESVRWSGDEKIEAARWLKSKMESEGKWKPITKAKKPGKDKNYQRTLNVQRWLDGH